MVFNKQISSLHLPATWFQSNNNEKTEDNIDECDHADVVNLGVGEYMMQA